ncbi:MAG TPA: hypothetical protein DD733_08925 [Clostridiales bacterium]|nr:hypothetical protein [Clostridiales bacterium]
MPPVKTIARIKKEIDEGYYMVVFCNSSLVFAREFKEETHEIFIYGYNDKKKVFFTSELQGSGFKESEITYENFVKGYRYRYDYLSKNKEQILAMRIFYYDITKIKLKKFDNETYFLLGFIRKINYEIIGSRSKVYLCKPNMEYNTPDIYHEGIACLAGIKESLKKFIDGTIGDIDCYDRLTLSLLKLYEHRKILLRNFKWLYEHFNISNPELLSEINNYEKCCENVKKMYSISLKNDLAHEGKFFVLDDISVKAYLKIIGLITSQFAFELKTLKKCSEMFTAWFYDYRAIKKKIEDGK